LVSIKKEIPVVTFDAESWTLMDKIKRVLTMREREILRKAYGQTYENGYWRIKIS
jgi:hypothetical protein